MINRKRHIGQSGRKSVTQSYRAFPFVVAASCSEILRIPFLTYSGFAYPQSRFFMFNNKIHIETEGGTVLANPAKAGDAKL